MADDKTVSEDFSIEEGLEDLAALDEIEVLKAERDELRDRFMRALADAENTRKRGERDRREAEQYGSTRLARDLLPVFDNLNRALNAATDEQKAAAAALRDAALEDDAHVDEQHERYARRRTQLKEAFESAGFRVDLLAVFIRRTVRELIPQT